MRVAFQVAEHDRDAITLGKPVELLVEDRRSLEIARVVRGPLDARNRVPFDDPSPRLVALSSDRRMTGDPVQPGPDRIAHPERAAAAGQDDKRRLECILSIVLVGQDGPAGAQDHRSMAIDHGRERQLGRVSISGRVALQQLPVRQTDYGPDVENGAQLVQPAEIPMSNHQLGPPDLPCPRSCSKAFPKPERSIFFGILRGSTITRVRKGR